MKRILGKLRFRKMDEMERHILFKAQRNAYLFLVTALIIWSFCESIQVYIHHSRLNLLPSLLHTGDPEPQRGKGRRGLLRNRPSHEADPAGLRSGRPGRHRGGGCGADGCQTMKNRIKALRKSRGYRQEDLAAALGVSRQTIIAIENDKYNPTLELAMKLARYLETTVEELFQLEV